MAKLKVAFVGWRGLVGSVLIDRMIKENDFAKIDSYFFSLSQLNEKVVLRNGYEFALENANNIERLIEMDIIVSTHGSDYSSMIYPQLIKKNYKGYWLDSASYFRMDSNATIVLDPINLKQIILALRNNKKLFVGANCTVSIMLLAIEGLISNNLIDWVSCMTYQAVSGAGSKFVLEYLNQMGCLYNNINDLIENNANLIDIDAKISQVIHSGLLPLNNFKSPLVCNVLPWIDKLMENDQTKEEWKLTVESHKIINGIYHSFNVDGICTRVGSIRSHAQALTIKLKDKYLSIDEIKQILQNNILVKVVDNNMEDTLKKLIPSSVANTLDIVVGRIRKLNFGDDYITMFTVGDQLLWGAAEPIRRMLNILINYHE